MKKQFVYTVCDRDSRPFMDDYNRPFYLTTDRQQAIEVAEAVPPVWDYDQRVVYEHPLNRRLKWDHRPVAVWQRPAGEAKALRLKWEVENKVRKVRRNMKSEFLDAVLSPAQKKLRRKHGTPAQFASAVFGTVPGFCSMDEAKAAIDRYNAEWRAAS